MAFLELFEITYHPDIAEKDLPRLSRDVKHKIRRAIEGKLVRAPEEFGEPLRRTLKGYWKLRVGDYRVIYKISGRAVLVLRIGHRREVYER
ncbi:MAG: type II toxin-antitoxin system RelE/ParE family toxin [Candidatus Omnitrophica bacterium]|nr:type II toxin-antitoxin system RelE/ParE family toxin [Candidatus Omnitrophota bacterium]